MRNAECGLQNLVSRTTHHAPRTSPAFTLLELLMVIAIMGIVAALAVPTLRGLKPNAKVAATRQLLDAVGRARQLANSQRTTVYMVFLPLNFFAGLTNNLNNWRLVQSLADKQLTGYAYVTLRSVGDHPGVHHPRYLAGSWKTLPKGAYIPPAKFLGGTNIGSVWIAPFPVTTVTNTIPFPSEDNPVSVPVTLPYIAFDGMGQLVSGQPGQPELIPIAEGSVSIARDPVTRNPLGQSAQANEMPPGNTVDNYSLVFIDRLTGRARVERRTVQ